MNGYIHKREDLKHIHEEIASWAELSFVIGGIAWHKQEDLEQRLAKQVGPLLERLKELEGRVGLMMIEIDHQQRLRASCEKALENRDERVKELEEATSKASDLLAMVGASDSYARLGPVLKHWIEEARNILKKKP